MCVLVGWLMFLVYLPVGSSVCVALPLGVGSGPCVLGAADGEFGVLV